MPAYSYWCSNTVENTTRSVLHKKKSMLRRILNTKKRLYKRKPIQKLHMNTCSVSNSQSIAPFKFRPPLPIAFCFSCFRAFSQVKICDAESDGNERSLAICCCLTTTRRSTSLPGALAPAILDVIGADVGVPEDDDRVENPLATSPSLSFTLLDSCGGPLKQAAFRITIPVSPKLISSRTKQDALPPQICHNSHVHGHHHLPIEQLYNAAHPR